MVDVNSGYKNDSYERISLNILLVMSNIKVLFKQDGRFY